MGGLSAIGKALERAGHQVSDEAHKALRTIEENPEILLGPVGVGIAGVKNLVEGRTLFGEHHGGARKLPPLPYSPHPVSGMLSAYQAAGRSVRGAQPFMFAGYFVLAGASAIVKDVDIADLLKQANTPLFGADNKFPSPFMAKRMKWTVITEPVDPAKEDAGWLETVYAVFSAQTEIARISLAELGLRTVVSGPLVTSGGGTTAVDTDKHGVAWPIYYDTNSVFKMSVRSATAIASTNKAMAFAYALDGWTIQDASMLDQDVSQVIEALAQLY